MILGFLLASLLLASAVDVVTQAGLVGLDGSGEDHFIDLEDSSEEPLVALHDKDYRSHYNGQVAIPTEPVTLTLLNRVHVFQPAPTV